MKKTITFLLAGVMTLFVGMGVVTCNVAPAYAAESEDANAPKPEFEYFELAPLVLPIITEGGLTQQVSLVVSLELPYGKKGEVEPYAPRLADAYLRDLYGALGVGDAMMRGDVVDVMAVKDRLTEVTTKVIGAERFNSVLLQVVQQSPR